MTERNFYNTYLTFGLTSEEKEYLEETDRNAVLLRQEVKNLVELHWVDCKKFSDVLATPAFMILIRLEDLEEDEFEAFNECFKADNIMIYCLGANPYKGEFAYYPDFDLLHDQMDQINLLRSMLIMEKRNSMLSSDDIKLSLTESYVAVDMAFEDNDDIIYEAVKIDNGKVVLKERIKTKSLSELKDWIGETTIIVWHRELNHNRKAYNKLDISDKLIDLFLLSASEYPILTVLQEIDELLKYFFKDCDEENDCLKIAYLFLIVLLNPE